VWKVSFVSGIRLGWIVVGKKLDEKLEKLDRKLGKFDRKLEKPFD
jgi:DNA-binding transcriptional MocR family regulator